MADLGSASLSFSSLSGWTDRGLREKFVALTDAVWRVRAYGDFYSYCLVAEGAVDVAAEPEVKLWDLAPLDVLVREAGGRFTNLDGDDGPHGGSAVASNGLLHAARARHAVTFLIGRIVPYSRVRYRFTHPFNAVRPSS